MTESVSRSALDASRLAASLPADDGVDLDGPPTASILLLAPGRVQRVDLWSGRVATVLHAFQTDPNVAAPASIHLGRSAAGGAVGAVLGTSSGSEVVAGVPVALATSVARLIEQIPSGTSAFGAEVGAFVIHRASDDSSIAVVPDAQMWGRAASDGTLELRVGRTAQLWAFVSSVLPSADLAPAAIQQAP